MNDVYWASDYAGLKTPLIEFYYGYEEVIGFEDDAEWCFTAKFGLVTLKIPHSQLGCPAKMFEVKPCLLWGIAKVLSEYKLVKRD